MRRQRRKKQFVSRFVGIEYIILNSPAFGELSGEAIKLLLYVCARHDGENNGTISFSVREAAAKLKCTPNTAGNRFRELIECGFLVPVTKGAFSVKLKAATTWRITFYPSPGGKPATRDYARWQAPEKQNTVSLGDIAGIKKRYRDAKNITKKSPTVLNCNTVKAESDKATVFASDTLIDSSHRPLV